MKKTFLLFAIAAVALGARAQVTLTGTSYTQNFTGLPTYPTGWSTYNNATATSLGTLEGIQFFGEGIPYVVDTNTAPTNCIGQVNVGGFKNFPSANVITPGIDFCVATPPTFSDRALGVRQVSPTNSTHPNLDPGAAFVLRIANTTSFKNFALSFKLQSLDTISNRVTTWTVDYGIGSTPTSFTPVTTTGTMTTGGKTFSNNTITANFGAALDNKSSNVYIRIAALSGTTGTGNRASSAIDDFTLTYQSTVAVSDVPAQPDLSLTVLGAATTERINLAYSAEEAGSYTLAIYDMTGRTVRTQNVNVQQGAQSIVIDGLSLATGMYIAKISNGNSSAVTRVVVQ